MYCKNAERGVYCYRNLTLANFQLSITENLAIKISLAFS